MHDMSDKEWQHKWHIDNRGVINTTTVVHASKYFSPLLIINIESCQILMTMSWNEWWHTHHGQDMGHNGEQ